MAIYTKTVLASGGWQGSGAVVRPKDKIVLDASGLWTPNPAIGYCDADGFRAFPTGGKPGYAWTGPNGYEGQLVATIAHKLTFVAGTHAEIHVPDGVAGELSLVINDDLRAGMGAGLTDNVGQQTVRLDVTFVGPAIGKKKKTKPTPRKKRATPKQRKK